MRDGQENQEDSRSHCSERESRGFVENEAYATGNKASSLGHLSGNQIEVALLSGLGAIHGQMQRHRLLDEAP